MRILHLAYEDPRQPGSGGGSVRTAEINRRLSSRHQITAIVAGYPGARERVEDGVRWVPVGTRSGGKLDRLGYFPLVLREVLRRPHDLVVEEFAAPLGPGVASLATSKPVIGSVQWLFAEEMRARYHLPFDLVERGGVRLYRNLIAVSGWLAEALRMRLPRASIFTIPNGVAPEAFAVAPAPPRHLVYLGRLDTAQKGCDLLLDIMKGVEARLGRGSPVLHVLGDGPDRGRLVRQADALGLRARVCFHGDVRGAEKYEMIAGAHAVLMPSRFETFGMVAVEAQAAGVPVVAFDVGPLREVAGGGDACLIPSFDARRFADAVVTIVNDPERRAHLGRTGRAWARQYDWDRLAEQQEQCYLTVVKSSVSGRSA